MWWTSLLSMARDRDMSGGGTAPARTDLYEASDYPYESLSRPILGEEDEGARKKKALGRLASYDYVGRGYDPDAWWKT